MRIRLLTGLNVFEQNDAPLFMVPTDPQQLENHVRWYTVINYGSKMFQVPMVLDCFWLLQKQRKNPQMNQVWPQIGRMNKMSSIISRFQLLQEKDGKGQTQKSSILQNLCWLSSLPFNIKQAEYRILIQLSIL